MIFKIFQNDEAFSFWDEYWKVKLQWRHDIRRNDTQKNDIQKNDTLSMFGSKKVLANSNILPPLLVL